MSPNPFQAHTLIHLSAPVKNTNLLITNLQGQRILQRSGLSGDAFEIQRGELQAGTYFYEMHQAGKAIATGKLLIVD